MGPRKPICWVSKRSKASWTPRPLPEMASLNRTARMRCTMMSNWAGRFWVKPERLLFYKSRKVAPFALCCRLCVGMLQALNTSPEETCAGGLRRHGQGHGDRPLGPVAHGTPAAAADLLEEAAPREGRLVLQASQKRHELLVLEEDLRVEVAAELHRSKGLVGGALFEAHRPVQHAEAGGQGAQADGGVGRSQGRARRQPVLGGSGYFLTQYSLYL